jgi:O-antigen/teichoic acid export membrane protein
MINKLKPKSEFSRNVLTLMTGTTIAQAIPIAISPILTRIYTPEDFGMFALYMSMASILSVVATGRYELAIMLPKKDEDAINIVALSLIISFLVSFIALLIIFFFNDSLTNLLGNPKISSWLYFIPLTVLFTGIYQSFNYWSNRKKHYKRLATSRVVQSGITASSNLGMGFGGFGGAGLIGSSILGQGVASFLLGKIIFKEDKNCFGKIKKLKIFALGRRYISFLTVNLPHTFLNVLSSNFPVLLISYFFGNLVTGFYSISNRVIVAPIGIITNSYGQVFLQHISSSTVSQKEKEFFFKKTVYRILGYSLVPFLLLFFFLPQLFQIIFGENWIEAGVYGQILIPMLYFRFVGSIVSSVTVVFNQQQKALKIEIINTLLRIFALIIGGIEEDIILGLILFSLFSIFVTIYRLFWYFEVVKGEHCGY